MAETSPSNVTGVSASEFNRLQRRTTISLVLSAVILILFLIGAIVHHCHKHHRFGGRYGRDGGCYGGQCQRGFGPRFHRFGGMGMMNQGWGGPVAFGGGPGMQGGMGGMNVSMGGPMMMAGPMGNHDPAKMAAGILNHLSTALSLTDDQKAKIKPIVEQQIAEIQKQMEAQRQVMQKEIEDAKAKIKPLLTADQQKQLDAIPLPGQKPVAPDEAKQIAPKSGE